MYIRNTTDMVFYINKSKPIFNKTIRSIFFFFFFLLIYLPCLLVFLFTISLVNYCFTSRIFRTISILSFMITLPFIHDVKECAYNVKEFRYY